MSILALLGFGLATFLQAAQEPKKRVALVFDDGPRPADVEPLLTLLTEEGVPATFSLVGGLVKENPATAKAILAAGFEIANHSQTHAHPRDLADQALDCEIADAQQAIKVATGFAPKWYWPPYIEIDDRVRKAATQAGLVIYEPKLIVASKDYDTSIGPDEIFRLATTGVQDGAVILFHEWRKETLARLPAILAELRRQGCTFFTFSGLDVALRQGPLTPN